MVRFVDNKVANHHFVDEKTMLGFRHQIDDLSKIGGNLNDFEHRQVHLSQYMWLSKKQIEEPFFPRNAVETHKNTVVPISALKKTKYKPTVKLGYNKNAWDRPSLFVIAVIKVQ